MQRSTEYQEAGVGRAVVFLAVVVVLVIAILALKLTNSAAPVIEMQPEIRGIGVNTPVDLNVHDSNYRIKSVVVEVLVAPCREQRHIPRERGAQIDS